MPEISILPDVFEMVRSLRSMVPFITKSPEAFEIFELPDELNKTFAPVGTMTPFDKFKTLFKISVRLPPKMAKGEVMVVVPSEASKVIVDVPMIPSLNFLAPPPPKIMGVFTSKMPLIVVTLPPPVVPEIRLIRKTGTVVVAFVK